LKRYAQLHFLVLILAATAVLGKLISLSSLGVVAWRTFFAFLGACVWVGLIRPRLARRKNVAAAPLWPGRGPVLRLIGIGALVGIHWLCFFGSVKLSNVSVCLLGLTTMSLFTAFTEPFFDRRRVRGFEVLLGLLIIGGVSLGFEMRYAAGLLVAMGAALLAAIFPALNRRLVKAGGDPQVMVAWEMLGALLVTLIATPFLSSYGELFAWHGLDWMWLLVLAWGCTVFAHSFQIHLLRHFNIYSMILAINFEPIYGVLAAAFLFNEYKELDRRFYFGMGATIVANLLHPAILRWDERRKRGRLIFEGDAADSKAAR